jgi:hypothetical protein
VFIRRRTISHFGGGLNRSCPVRREQRQRGHQQAAAVGSGERQRAAVVRGVVGDGAGGPDVDHQPRRVAQRRHRERPPAVHAQAVGDDGLEVADLGDLLQGGEAGREAARRDGRPAALVVGVGALEHDLQVGAAGHRHRLAGAVLDELVDVADVAGGRHGAAELEHHPVEAGVAARADVDQGRGGLGASGCGGEGQHQAREADGENDGPDEPHGDHLPG